MAMGWPGFRVHKLLCMAMVLPLLAVSAGCRQSPWTLWNAYAAHFIDAQGRVIDPRVADRSTSEGQSYALFFALVDDDRARFDKVLAWTQANMAAGDLSKHLPGWDWGKNKDGAWTVLDSNSASDADIWMAYTLVEAGRLWKAPGYTSLGRAMLVQIARQEVVDLPGFGAMMLPGPTGFQHDRTATTRSWMINPSYLPLFIFERLAVVDPQGPWQRIALNIPRLLQESAVHGYAMDWVEYLPGDGFYPVPAHEAPEGKEPEQALGSYDAIRVYLWAGMLDENNRRRTEMLGAVAGMRAYLADHDAPPEKISDEGIPMAQDGPVGFSAALLPYLRAFPQGERTTTKQMLRLSAQKDAGTGLYGKDQAYYDQNLALFASGFFEGRFKFGQSGELKVEWTRG
jgi:endoglucanase